MGNGLKVSFGAEMTGYIHQDYLSSPADAVKEYAVGTEITARLGNIAAQTFPYHFDVRITDPP